EDVQSLVGVAVALGLCWGLSEDRRRFPWKLAVGAVAVQALLVLGLFGLPVLRTGLLAVGQVVDGLSARTQAGVAFVFGFLAGTPDQPYALTTPRAMFVCALRVLAVGMSCVSGSTMVAYATILKPVMGAAAAAHVLAASIISAPAGVLLARILVPRNPETEKPEALDPGAAKVYESSVDTLIK